MNLSNIYLSAMYICDNCDDVGRTMTAELYPNGHTEVWEDCEQCEIFESIYYDVKQIYKKIK